MNFYYLFFGVLLALQQLGLKRIKRNLRFLNYYWGKALFCLFIGSVSLSNRQNSALQYMNAALFLLMSALLGAMACTDRQVDLDQMAKDETAWEEFWYKQSFKKDPASFYMDQVKM